MNALSSLPRLGGMVYDVMVRRFLSIFLPACGVPESGDCDEDKGRVFLLKL